MLTTAGALVTTGVIALVTFLCRAVPFLFFSSSGEESERRAAFIAFVERAVPPVAMTVLAATSIAAAITAKAPWGLPAVLAGIFTATVHLWKRNALLSIAGGTVLYMVLNRIFM